MTKARPSGIPGRVGALRSYAQARTRTRVRVRACAGRGTGGPEDGEAVCLLVSPLNKFLVFVVVFVEPAGVFSLKCAPLGSP
jgi:hypothetical protein